MESTNSLLIIGIIVGLVVGFLLAHILSIKRTVKDRQSSIKASKAVILGHAKEQLAPLLPGFPYHPKDLVFIGKGFDYLVLDGLHEGSIKRIVFLEIKTGNAQQNKNEKLVEYVIINKLVTYEIIRL